MHAQAMAREHEEEPTAVKGGPSQATDKDKAPQDEEENTASGHQKGEQHPATDKDKPPQAHAEEDPGHREGNEQKQTAGARAKAAAKPRTPKDEAKKQAQLQRAQASIQRILGFGESMGDCRPPAAFKPGFDWQKWSQL